MVRMVSMDPPDVLPEGALAWRLDTSDEPEDSRYNRYKIESPGPWSDEPDKVQWVDPDTGLDCLIVRNPMGSLCGYVGVPSDHPAYGKPYDDVPVQVHGGLTFGDMCQSIDGVDEDEPTPGVCHVPFPGRPHDVYWLGFDCGHSFDLQPGLRDMEERLFPDDMKPSRVEPLLSPGVAVGGMWGSVYRDVAYVVSEIRGLAYQLASVKV